jgi:type VI secretion system protein ImpC
LKERKFVAIDRDHFDQVLEQAAPRLTLTVPDRLGGGDKLSVELSFRRLEDFEPVHVAAQVEGLRALLDSRRQAASMEPPDAPRVADCDRKLSAQLREILRHPDFRRLEATWRGLRYLVDQTATSEGVKIRILNVAKRELAEDAAKVADFDETVLYGKVYKDEFEPLEGEPYGLLVGDFAFDGNVKEDVSLLRSLSDVAAYAHAPFVASASPRMFGLERYGELPGRRDLPARFAGEEYADWRAFRAADASRFVALTLPAALARPPYGAGGVRAEGFDFEEAADGRNADDFVWMSAAWPFAARAADAFAHDGWPARTHV